MSKRLQAFRLLGPLLLVEGTAYWKVTTYLSWGTEQILAYAAGLAFVSLLLSGIVALSQDISPEMRRSIFLGGVLLFAIRGLANVLVTYQYGMEALPIEIPMQFFAIDAETARKSTALIQGSALSLTSILFWRVLATMLSQHLEEMKQRKAMFSQIEDYLSEEASTTA